ncbi:hypothetical protein EJB05_15918, partial [Eragrostis curvula]
MVLHCRTTRLGVAVLTDRGVAPSIIPSVLTPLTIRLLRVARSAIIIHYVRKANPCFVFLLSVLSPSDQAKAVSIQPSAHRVLSLSHSAVLRHLVVIVVLPGEELVASPDGGGSGAEPSQLQARSSALDAAATGAVCFPTAFPLLRLAPTPVAATASGGTPGRRRRDSPSGSFARSHGAKLEREESGERMTKPICVNAVQNSGKMTKVIL